MTPREQKALREQYLLYGNAQSSARNPKRDVRAALLKMADPAQLGMEGMGGILIEQASKAGDEIKSRSGEAADRLAQGGETAASHLERAAQAFLGAVQALGRLTAMPTMPSTGVNANTGRSMPPAAGRPAGTGRQ